MFLRRRNARLGSPTGGYLLTACFASGRVAGERPRLALEPWRGGTAMDWLPLGVVPPLY